MTSNTAAVLFDLDGTLIDSLPDIHGALNALMQERGLPDFTTDQVRRFVGGGVHVLIDRAMAAQNTTPDVAERADLVARFVALYGPRATQLTQPRTGAAAILHSLRANGLRTAVVTNKPLAATRAILAHFNLLPLFDVVIGGDAGPALKPDPGLVLLALRELSVAPDCAVFVGDSENDVQAAHAATVKVAVLTEGYTAHPAEALGADIVMRELAEITAWLATLAASPALPG